MSQGHYWNTFDHSFLKAKEAAEKELADMINGLLVVGKKYSEMPSDIQ